MKKILGCVLIALIVSNYGKAQTRFIVRFKDKGNSPYQLSSPSGFLSQKAIDRRTKYSITYDSTDLPVTPAYIDSVLAAGDVSILNVSKWLNAVSIFTTDIAAIDKINSFPFVQNLNGIALKIFNPASPDLKFKPGHAAAFGSAKETGITEDAINYGASYSQLHLNHGEFLHNIGLRGENMVIGMLDAGFQNYLTVKSLDSIRSKGQILGVYDFVSKDSSVNENHSHGMQCLSTIAANIPGEFVGTAPKSFFYLFRSEDSGSEFPIEELNWVCAAERVDSLGGDVISSSLGYNTFDSPFEIMDHPFSDMDGNTTMAAKGADLAARKGILVVNSAGNEGNNGWGKIITPADGDSVLAVGAVTSWGSAAAFTSRGPSADGQVKPDVAAHGVNTTVQLPNNTIGVNNGTSFAAPNMAGMATCLWQGFPEFNNMRVIEALRAAGNKASQPDDSTGYGIPDMRKAFMHLLKQFVTTSATGPSNNCEVVLNWKSKDNAGMRYEIERSNPGQPGIISAGRINTTESGYSIRNYQLKDTLYDVNAGNITYRIRQVVDTSATGYYADYIDTLTITATSACIAIPVDPTDPSDNEIAILPNPARSDFKLKLTTARPISPLVIRLFDAKGREVYNRKESKPAGPVIYFIPVSQLASGKYYVSVYEGANLLSTKELLKL